MKRCGRMFSLFSFLLLVTTTTLQAQPIRSSVKHGSSKSLLGIEVHFQFDKSELALDYMDNVASLARFAEAINDIGLHRIDSVVIVSQSSPEGAYAHNVKLSQRRAATMQRIIEERHPELGNRLYVHPDGESWERLREYVVNDTRMKQSSIDQVLRVIDSDVNIHTKKWRMEQLPVYRYLRQTYYPRIRNSVFCIIYFDLPLSMAGIDIPVEEVELMDTLPMLPPVVVEPRLEDTPLLVKTNFVYDALLAPSVELEYRMAPHWSVLADYSVAWWSVKPLHWYYQIMQLNPEVRYWFGTDESWRGHYVGLFAGSGYYDLEGGARGYKGEFLMSGLTYGYMFPIGKRLSLDTGIGVGVLTTKYEEYLPMDGHYVFQQTGRTRYLGPLKLRVALTWRIDRWKFKAASRWLKGGAR